MKQKKRYQDMTAAELAEATKDFDKPWTGRRLPGRTMTPKERAWFESWQKKALAEEAAELDEKQIQSVTLLLPTALVSRIGEVAKEKHTTPAALVKRIVQDAIYHAVA